MNISSSSYPALSERRPLPALYLPACCLLITIPHLVPVSKRTVAIVVTFPILLSLSLGLPFFDCGSKQDDYYAAPTTFLFLSFFLENVVCPPEDGLRFVGRDRDSGGVGLEDCRTLWAKLEWAFKLLPNPRGIGWTWQVKNVAAIKDADLPRWRFVMRRLTVASYYFALKVCTLYLLGINFALNEGINARSSMRVLFLSATKGWLTAAWSYQDLQSRYHGVAAISVGLGIYDQWEWPPLFGSFRDAWSVRQMWSVSWHQTTRRMNSGPSIRLARLLGLRKGSLSSRYFQLYFGFFISALLHEWNAFNATRKDGGEMWFFMIQPVAITAEDFVQYCWIKSTGASRGQQQSSSGKVVGWVWTFLWFSYTLPVFASSLIECGLLEADTAKSAMVLGRKHASSLSV